MTVDDREALLRQEVEELTEMLKTDPGWNDLREVLANANMAYNEVLLAGLFESEDWREWGAIVTKEGKVYRYERNTKPNAPAEFKYFKRVSNIEKYSQEWHPAVKVALQIISEKSDSD